MAIITPKHVQKVCTLWVHEDNFSKEDAVFNVGYFPDGITIGSLVQVVAVKEPTAVHDLQPATGKPHEDGSSGVKKEGSAFSSAPGDSIQKKHDSSAPDVLGESGTPLESVRTFDPQNCYVFVVQDMSSEMKAKHPGLQISLSRTTANLFGFRGRMQVLVSLADVALHSASHAEISFRDEYLARADMWRMAVSELSQKSVYKGQKLLFMGTIKAIVKNVYVRQKKARSAYFSGATKPIFRSESARYILFIQMSKEMWDFDAEGSGEIMFSKVIHGFLPDLFKRWAKMKARHLVSIILFTRVEYDRNMSTHTKATKLDRSSLSAHRDDKDTQDSYRVVVSEMASDKWIDILGQLKREFKVFLRDVSILKNPNLEDRASGAQDAPIDGNVPEYIIAGKPSTAMRGNILEAINLASSQFSKDYIDRDLVRTGISVAVVTPGTGVFEVNYDMLKLTTDTLVGNGIGIDLVALSRMPLHSVPLFKYRTPLSKAAVPADNLSASFEDENTPRQAYANFNSVSSRTMRKPSSKLIEYDSNPLYQSPGIPSATPDEWSYALPHWIDVSFWTGKSEESMEAHRSRNNRARYASLHSGHSEKPFCLRCRMYEMQMMGVMEKEMSNICIPYLHEDPLCPPQPWSLYLKPVVSRSFQSTQMLQADAGTLWERPSVSVAESSPSRTSKTHRTHSSSVENVEAYRWMDKYDEAVFPSSAELEASRISRSHPLNASQMQADDTTLYGTLSDDRGFSHDRYGNAAGLTYLDRKMKGRIGTSPLASPPRDSFGSFASTAYTPTSKHARLPRHVSLGPRGFGVSKPTAIAQIEPANAKPAAVLTQGHKSSEVARSQDSSTTSGQIRAALKRHSSQYGGLQPIASAILTQTDLSPEIGHPQYSSTTSNQPRAALKRPLPQYGGSRPIAIRSASRSAEQSESTTLDAESRPKDTAKGEKPLANMDALITASVAKRAGPQLNLALIEIAHGVLKTSKNVNTPSPWLTLLNPSNPRKNNMSIASHFRRWQHVFPRPIRTSAIKWKSLCSPAALPLTNEYFPTAEQLATEYHESPYKIAQNDEQNEEDELSEVPQSREALIRELIAFRLSHGFQLVVGAAVAEFAGKAANDMVNIFDKDYMAEDGAMVFMSVGNVIHQLLCVAGGEVEVRRFNRRPTSPSETPGNDGTRVVYEPSIRTVLAKEYETRQIVLKSPPIEHNWNYIDHYLAGYHDDFSDVLRFWRARFVLIPVEPPKTIRRFATVNEDSEEETRLEGIQKLTQMWQRYRFVSPEERLHQKSLRLRPDTNPLAIEYQTRDPSAVVAAYADGFDKSLLAEGDPNALPSQLFAEAELYHSSNFDLHKLAQDVQAERPKGVKLIDRRWHWKYYHHCFRGDEFTSWLLQHFKDIENRDTAVELGEKLMQLGLFQHVQQKHKFRDGHFFYHIAKEYLAPHVRSEARAGWFRRSDRSVPSTPIADGARGSPIPDRSRSRSATENSSTGSGRKTPTGPESGIPKLELSHVLRYDVDHRKKSYRPELINLHYDRIHNPDNCYHIRIDWMNVTAKLIEDAIVTWATTAERYGLKLVELPIAEASSISEAHPFRAAYLVKLVVSPPEGQPLQYFEPTSFNAPQSTDRHFYQKAVLRKFNFVLDLEAANSFTAKVEVSYSWGKPDYRFTQFIHKSGILLAQITDEGHLVFLANRLCNNRAAVSDKFDKVEGPDRRFALQSASDKPSPCSSPPVRAVPDNLLSPFTHAGADKTVRTPEEILEDMEAFCQDPKALKAFYEDASKISASPSPHTTPMLDSIIPSMGLPPSIAARERSPMPALGPSILAGSTSRSSSMQSSRLSIVETDISVTDDKSTE
ncbi:vacuolar membrane-associated protein-like protein IML1 [Cryomyces antarcticus]